MEFIFIRIVFLSLLSFDLLNSVKVLHVPLDFSWLVLFLISFLTWAFWEKVYKKRFDFPVLMGSFFAFHLSADTLANAFGLYGKFHWYDEFTHFTGGAMVGVLTISALGYLNKKNQWKLPLKFLMLFAISLALSLGVLYEFWEYFAYSVLNYNLIILSVTDTSKDLLFDFIGAATSIILLTFILKKKGYFLPNSIDSKTK